MMQAEPHSGRCHACGEYFIQVWRVGAELWTEVTGEADGSGVLCMTCFEDAAEANGLQLYWECASGHFPLEPPPAKPAPAADRTSGPGESPGPRFLKPHGAESADDKAFRNVLQLNAAIYRVADALRAAGVKVGAGGGVDTENEVDEATGRPFGLGGHTALVLERAINELRARAERADALLAKVQELERYRATSEDAFTEMLVTFDEMRVRINELSDERDRLQRDLEAARKGSQTRRCLVCGEWVKDVPGPKDPRWHVCVKHRGITKAETPFQYIAELRRNLEAAQRALAGNA